MSIAIAFLIGTIKICGVLTSELHHSGGFWDFVSVFDINTAGFIVAGLFVVVWMLAIAYWKLGRVESRWVPATVDERA